MGGSVFTRNKKFSRIFENFIFHRIFILNFRLFFQKKKIFGAKTLSTSEVQKKQVASSPWLHLTSICIFSDPQELKISLNVHFNLKARRTSAWKVERKEEAMKNYGKISAHIWEFIKADWKHYICRGEEWREVEMERKLNALLAKISLRFFSREMKIFWVQIFAVFILFAK